MFKQTLVAVDAPPMSIGSETLVTMGKVTVTGANIQAMRSSDMAKKIFQPSVGEISTRTLVPHDDGVGGSS
jgi:hypothetical protein